ncbi:YbaB/EbfC family nucleoid-associated protein [Treponema pectinovorum]|uniref:YbaB/EbfC family nucleoid-associated protein n=1 Tax=Treponema pectinovorum TaxID=164 RepID=UPI003D94CA9D
MNPFDLVKNLKDIQGTMTKLKEEMASLTATGSSGGNMVQVTVNGQMEMTAIKIDPIAVDPRDVKMLEDLIVAATHNAIEKIQEIIKEKAGPMMSGMDMSKFGL